MSTVFLANLGFLFSPVIPSVVAEADNSPTAPTAVGCFLRTKQPIQYQDSKSETHNPKPNTGNWQPETGNWKPCDCDRKSHMFGEPNMAHRNCRAISVVPKSCGTSERSAGQRNWKRSVDQGNGQVVN